MGEQNIEEYTGESSRQAFMKSLLEEVRGLKPCVHFGDHWVNDSVTEIFKEDITRFRVILTTETEDDLLVVASHLLEHYLDEDP